MTYALFLLIAFAIAVICGVLRGRRVYRQIEADLQWDDGAPYRESVIEQVRRMERDQRRKQERFLRCESDRFMALRRRWVTRIYAENGGDHG